MTMPARRQRAKLTAKSVFPPDSTEMSEYVQGARRHCRQYDSDKTTLKQYYPKANKDCSKT